MNIIEQEKANGLSDDIYQKAKQNFLNRYEKIDFNKYYLDSPFKESCLALYNWAPIADELKTLDKEKYIFVNTPLDFLDAPSPASSFKDEVKMSLLIRAVSSKPAT